MKEFTGKVVIVGAGFVGATTAYAMAQKNIASEIVLVDINHDKAEGEALDINHGLSFIGETNIYAGDYSDCRNADIIVITAGANRKPGETRLDLAKKNATIMRGITDSIMEHYNGALIVMVSNPVDVLTYLFHKQTGIPAHKIIGSGTLLDSSRLQYVLGKKCKVDVNDINAYVIGEHGDSAVPVWSAANIWGTNVDDYYASLNNDERLDKAAVFKEVQQSGATVIKFKGATYFAIALSVTNICDTILKNKNTVLPVGAIMNGSQYGITDVALSVPCVVGSTGIKAFADIKLSDEEVELLKESADKLKETIAQVI